MNLKYTLVLLVCFAAFAYGQICHNKPYYNYTSELCPFKTGVSCCNTFYFNEMESMIRMLEELGGLKKKCIERFRDMICYECHPRTHNLQICSSWCKRLLKDCSIFDSIYDDFDMGCDQYPTTNCFDGFDFEPLPPREICGTFGDPHLLTFNSGFHTCKLAGTGNVMYESDFFKIVADHEEVDARTGATVTTKLTVEHKKYGKIEVVRGGSLPTFTQNIDSGIYQDTSSVLNRASYTFYDSDDRLVITRTVTEVFYVVTSPRVGKASAYCNAGCTGQTIDVPSFLSSVEASVLSTAKDACEVVKNEDKNVYEACLFDVTITENVAYAESAKAYSEVYKEFELENAVRASETKTIVNVMMLIIASVAVILF